MHTEKRITCFIVRASLV